MKQTNKVLLISASVVSVTTITMSVLLYSKIYSLKQMKAGAYTLVINKDNPLVGGNVFTGGGTKIHFDEYGVDEVVNDGLLELAAYGNVSLQTYISGIEKVRVWSEVADEKAFFLTIGATPNSCEYTNQSYNGYAQVDLIDGFEGDCFYFSVHNKTENPITLTKIEIDYSCKDSESGLKSAIDGSLGCPIDNTYNGKALNPYDYGTVDPSRIPSNRHLIPTMSEDEYPTVPGLYSYGYDVYDIDETTLQPRKLLYTRTKNFKIRGERLTPIPDGRKVVTFHIPDENGKEKLICQETQDTSYNLANLPSECQKYSWESPYNYFQYIGDEHYYPVFRVSGISSMKEGDGCYPVHTTYSYLERGFTMPEPQMKTGYKFGGWFTDVACTIPFDESKIYPGNLTLYAKCIETDLDVRRVYYHNEDGTLSTHVDYLMSSDEKVTLPIAKDIMDLPRPFLPFYWAVYCGNIYMGLYKQPNPSFEEPGDKIKYSDFSGKAGDVHIYATELKRIDKYNWSYDLFSQDGDGNNVFQHTQMASSFKRYYDFVIPGFAVRARDNGEYHDQADSFKIDRIGQFFMTDEKEAFLIDGGTLKTISSYGYGNIEMRKPLSGILRHELVKKVGRRAFFNRYGVKGTYFPKNATDFEIEAYANVTFHENGVLTLPHNLAHIGDRCFLGSSNIKFVCLPRTIKTIGRNAFAYATYNKETRTFENITDRTVPGNSAITFLYEGSETDFNILDDVTKDAIKKNAYKIVYNYSYGTYYGRG